MSHEQTDERAGGVSRWAVLRAGAGAGFALALGGAGAGGAQAQAPAAPAMRWDFPVGQREGDVLTVRPGGAASARSRENQRITISGDGTFVPGAPRRVTGGGTFRVQDAEEAVLAEGTFRVTELLSWEAAPGGPAAPPPPLQIVDLMGDAAFEDRRPGLATFRVAYSDGREGTLLFSCRLTGTPTTVVEGIAASYGFLLFWNVEERDTLFHVIRSAAAPAALPRTGGDGAGVGAGA